MLSLGAQHAANGPEEAGAEGPDGEKGDGANLTGGQRAFAEAAKGGIEQGRNAEHGDEMPPGKAPSRGNGLAQIERSRRLKQRFLDRSLDRPNSRRDLR
jgi:hypothetical protein